MNNNKTLKSTEINFHLITFKLCKGKKVRGKEKRPYEVYFGNYFWKVFKNCLEKKIKNLKIANELQVHFLLIKKCFVSKFKLIKHSSLAYLCTYDSNGGR